MVIKKEMDGTYNPSLNKLKDFIYALSLLYIVSKNWFFKDLCLIALNYDYIPL